MCHTNKLVFLLISFIVLNINSVISSHRSHEGVNCCDGDNRLVNKTCSNGEPWNINCEYGRYMMDPKSGDDDEFDILDDGVLLQKKFDFRVAKGQ